MNKAVRVSHPKWEQQGHDFVEGKRCHRPRTAIGEQKIVNRYTVPQSPSLALAEALQRVEVWAGAEPERLLLFGRRVGIVELPCRCCKTSGVLVQLTCGSLKFL